MFIVPPNACPYCWAEGRKKLNHCKLHGWSYDGWLDPYRDVMSGLKEPKRKPRNGV